MPIFASQIKDINRKIMSKPIIAPSLLSANFLNLREDIEKINSSDADWLHVDIMDGVFVKNKTMPWSFCSQHFFRFSSVETNG